jgi:RNA polymerase sigma-70 factor (ECF subfamily)
MNIFQQRGSNQASVTPSQSTGGAADQALLRACVEGAPGAWRDLHRACYPTVRRFALGMGVTGDDLPDFCQEVFIQVFRYLGRFKGDAAFKTWLYRICLSQVGRLHRRRRLRDAVQRIFWVDPPPAATPSSGPLSEAVVRVAEQAIAQLKPHLREVFVMFEIEGLDGAEIAAVLQCPAGTVRRRLHQARQQIESAIQGDGPGDSDDRRVP